MTRAEFADALEEAREELLQSIKRYPVEIETKVGDRPYRRLVINNSSDLDLAIAQLRAPAKTVDPNLAVNRSLLVE